LIESLHQKNGIIKKCYYSKVTDLRVCIGSVKNVIRLFVL